MNANFQQTFAATGMGAEHAYRLARNSFEGSFAEASAKKRYVERLDAAFAAA
jgi:adenine deaminase